MYLKNIQFWNIFENYWLTNSIQLCISSPIVLFSIFISIILSNLQLFAFCYCVLAFVCVNNTAALRITYYVFCQMQIAAKRNRQQTHLSPPPHLHLNAVKTTVIGSVGFHRLLSYSVLSAQCSPLLRQRVHEQKVCKYENSSIEASEI